MRTTAQAETSLKAYLKKKQEGTLTEDKEKVYQIIKKHGPITLKATARRMNKFPNEISGRFTELRNEYDMIEIVGKNQNGRIYDVKE